MPGLPVVVKRNGVLERHEADAGLLWDSATGEVTILNPVGMTVWLLCDGQNTRDDIVHAVQAAYPEVDPAQVERDVGAFLAKLCELELVTEVQDEG